MATQDDSGISFSIRKEENRQQIRLLELPSPLLALLTSKEPPVLKFKSNRGSAGNELGSNAVFCTPTSTYNIRQVNHSNSQYITQPLPATGEELSNPRIEAFSSSGFVLELSADTSGSALPFLQDAVPVWHGDPELLGDNVPRMSKQEHFDNVPLDDAACERAWLELCCCEVQGIAQQPTNLQQLQAWQYILSTLRLEGVDALSAMAPETLGTLRQDSNDVDLPREVLDAVLSALIEEESLHHDKCLRFVGLRLLSDKHRASVKDFMQEWKDNLPEQWRDDITTDLLTGHFTLQNNGDEILYNGTNHLPTASTTSAADAPTTNTTGSKRKWHEKFRPSKKAS